MKLFVARWRWLPERNGNSNGDNQTACNALTGIARHEAVRVSSAIRVFSVPKFRYMERYELLMRVLTLNGLKCGPAALHESLRLPFWWMWRPWRPGFSPRMVPLIMTGPSTENCSKFNAPLMDREPAMPRITARALNISGSPFRYTADDSISWKTSSQANNHQIE